jgi:hypothetical protein
VLDPGRGSYDAIGQWHYGNAFPVAMGIIVVSLNTNCTMLTCPKVCLKKNKNKNHI